MTTNGENRNSTNTGFAQQIKDNSAVLSLLVTILLAIAGLFIYVTDRYDRLEDKLGASETKLNGKLTTLNDKFDTKFSALSNDVSEIKGQVDIIVKLMVNRSTSSDPISTTTPIVTDKVSPKPELKGFSATKK